MNETNVKPQETNALWCYPEDHKKAKIKCIEKGMTQMEFIKYLLELDKKYGKQHERDNINK